MVKDDRSGSVFLNMRNTQRGARCLEVKEGEKGVDPPRSLEVEAHEHRARGTRALPRAARWAQAFCLLVPLGRGGATPRGVSSRSMDSCAPHRPLTLPGRVQ